MRTTTLLFSLLPAFALADAQLDAALSQMQPVGTERELAEGLRARRIAGVDAAAWEVALLHAGDGPRARSWRFEAIGGLAAPFAGPSVEAPAGCVHHAERVLAFAARGRRAESSVAFLVLHQLPQGGWGANHRDADLPTTALILRALGAVRARPPVPVADSIARGVAWLTAQDLQPTPQLYTALVGDALAAVDALTPEGLAAVRAAAPWHDAIGVAAAIRVLVAARPELRVDLAAADVAPAAGAPVSLTARVHNRGLAAAPPTTVTFTAAAAESEQPVDALAPGASVDIEWRHTPTEPGGLTVRATVEDDQASIRLRVRAATPPDLEVRPDLVRVDPLQPEADGPFRVVAVVRNLGDAPTVPTAVAFYLGNPDIDGELLGVTPIDALDPGAEHPAVLEVPGRPAARHRLFVDVDPEQRVADHPGNDRAVRTLRIVQGADLALPPGLLTLDPGPVVSRGAPLHLRVRVRNHGDEPSPPSAVAVGEAGHPELARAPLPALAPGAVAERTLTLHLDERRRYDLLVRADPDDTLIERSEADNLAAASVEVQEVDLHATASTIDELHGRDWARFGFHRGTRLSVDTTPTNTGNIAASNFRVEVRADAPDGPALGFLPSVTIKKADYNGAEAQRMTVWITTDPLEPGEHTLYTVLDTTDVLAETNEADNISATQVLIYDRLDHTGTLSFDPAEPHPGERVDITWNLPVPEPWPNHSMQVRVTQGERVLYLHSSANAPAGAGGVIEWTAPELRGDVPFRIQVDELDRYADVDPANNTRDYTLHIGGPPVLTRLRVDAVPVAGVPNTIVCEVDGDTDVTFRGETLLATPGAPARFPWTPAAPGFIELSATTEGGERTADIEVRRPALRPDAPIATPVPEGVDLSWAPVGASHHILRDDRPIGPTAELDSAFAVPGEGVFELELPAGAWIAGANADFGLNADRDSVLWRLEARVGDQWVELHQEVSQGPTPGGVAQTSFPPVRARRLRLHVIARNRALPRALRLLELAPILDVAWRDEEAPASARYAIVAIEDGVPGEDGPAIAVEHPLAPTQLEATLEGSEVTLRWTPTPGRRAAGFLLTGDADIALAPARYPGVLTRPDAPWVFPRGTPLLEGDLRFATPRPVSEVRTAPDERPWRVVADGAPFEPGLAQHLNLTRAHEPGESGITVDPVPWGPPLLDAAGGETLRLLPAGANRLEIRPIDRSGATGPPAVLELDVAAPPPITDLEAELIVIWVGRTDVHLSWLHPTATRFRISLFGEVIAETDSPEFTHGSANGVFLYAVRAVDDAGNLSPAVQIEVRTGDLERPDNVRIDVDAFAVAVSWDPIAPRAVDHWRVYLDGEHVGSTFEPGFEFLWPTPGPHQITVREVDSNGVYILGPLCAPVAFTIEDDGPPGAAPLTPPETWRISNDGFTVEWAAPPDVDVVGYHVWLDDDAEPYPHGNQTSISRVLPWRRDVRQHTVRVAAYDGAGHVGPISEASLEVPHFPALQLGWSAWWSRPIEGEVSLTASGPSAEGHWLYRNGERVCVYESVGRPSVSSGEYGDVFWRDPNGDFWEPEAGDPEPWIGVLTPSDGVAGHGKSYDRVRVAFSSVEQRAVNYTLQTRDHQGRWHDALRVTDNDQLLVTHELPESPRWGGTGLRLVPDRPNIAVSWFYVEICNSYPPTVHSLPGGGDHVYTARPWSGAGDPGPVSEPFVFDTPYADAAVRQHEIALSDDEPLVGDTLSVVVPIHELGGVAIDALEVQLRLVPEEGEAPPPQRQSIALSPNGVTPAVFAWTIEHRAGDLEITIDPDNVLPELREENNQAVRALFADLPYRTQGFTYQRVLVMGTEPNTRYEIRSSNGTRLARGELGRDETVDVVVPDAEGEPGQIVTIAADRPFLAVSGIPYAASGMHVRGLSDNGLATRHLTPISRSTLTPKGDVEELDSLVLYAPEAAEVVVSDLEDGAVLHELQLAPHTMRAVEPQRHPERLVRRALIESDTPVLAWSFSDTGYLFVGTDGRLSGTELVGFVSRGHIQGASTEVLLWSFEPDNRVMIERTDTGEVLWEGLLPRHAVRSVVVDPPSLGEIVPLRVHASATMAASSAVLDRSPGYGYEHGFFSPAVSGRLIGHRFVVPLTDHGGDAVDGVLFTYYDATPIRVIQPDTGEVLIARVLGRGEHLDISDEVKSGHGERRRLVVEADRPVSVYTGLGAASACFMPLLFSQPPDLTFGDLRTEPPDPQPGEVVTVVAELHNRGAVRARRVRAEIYDGPPEQGRLVHAANWDRLDAGQPAEIRFELGVAEGERVLTFFADPEDIVREADEANNRATMAIANPPDLTPTAILVDATADRANAVEITVSNLGGRPVEGATLRLRAEEALVGATQLDVEALGTATATIPWRPEHPGPHTLTATIEPIEGEARADNNQHTADTDVAPAPLDLTAHIEVRPADPGPCDELRLHTRVSPPFEVELELEHEGATVARGRTGPDGVATLRWLGDHPIGDLETRLHLDTRGEVTETDEDNNVVDLPITIRAYATQLVVEGPESVERGQPITLRITPSSPLPPEASLQAEGFTQSGPFSLRATADHAPGLHRFTVKARRGPRVIATGQTQVEVVEPGVRLTLRAVPPVAGPGEPVTLEARSPQDAPIVLSVDGQILLSARHRARAIDGTAAPGEHTATAELRVGDEVLARAEAVFHREAAGVQAQLALQLADQRALQGDEVTVPITLESATGMPTGVARLHLAVATNPPRGNLPMLLLAEVTRDEPRVVLEPVEISLALPTDGLPLGASRLIARAEAGDGRLLGYATAAIEIEPRPDDPSPDAGRLDASIPDAAVPDASIPDAVAPDASSPDGALPDGHALDASVFDLEPPDAPTDGPRPDDAPDLSEDDPVDAAIDVPTDLEFDAPPGAEPRRDGGGEGTNPGAEPPAPGTPSADCGCGVGETPTVPAWLALIGALGLLRRRRRSSSSSAS